jgi:hypothetical protein
LEGSINGAAFELSFSKEDALPSQKAANKFIPQVEGSSLIKYISLNKVSVSVLGGARGKREKLLIIRDLTTMVNL